MLHTKLVRAWYKVGSCLVQSWFMLGMKLFRLGTKLVHDWYEVGSCLPRIWFVLGTKLVRTSYEVGSYFVYTKFSSEVCVKPYFLCLPCYHIHAYN